MSRLLPVVCIDPCVSIRAVPWMRTPVPRLSPVAYLLSLDDDAPAAVTVWYDKVANDARSFLNPVVLTLARLFEITRIRDAPPSSMSLADFIRLACTS